MLAYCTALQLAEGHLVYAKGNATEITHTVRYAGITIHAHTPDLAVAPSHLLIQVDELASRIAGAALSTNPTSRLYGEGRQREHPGARA
jgi:5-methylcytosine-specific restriction enzyme subunit McrC